MSELTRICVFAGSNAGCEPVFSELAKDVGHTLAKRKIGLVYGGARVGLMGAMADAVLAGGGEVIGVIPRALIEKEVAHKGLSKLYVVESMHERKATMTSLSDGFIAIPGGFGTLDELFEVLTWAQLGLHNKPCGVLNIQGYFDGLLSFLRHTVEQGFVRSEYLSMLAVSKSPSDLVEQFEHYTAPKIEKWIDRAAS